MSPVNNKRMSIIEKVIKLLALAEGSSFSEEAASAKVMASELMAKHNIDLGEIKQDEFVIEFVDSGSKIADKALQRLYNTVAKFNGVKLYTSGKAYWRGAAAKNAGYTLVGRPQDLEVTRYMFDVIKAQHDLALTTLRKEKGLKYTDMTHGFKTQFKRGFVVGVSHKIEELLHMQNSKIQEWGLVPVSVDSIAAKWYEDSHRTSTGRGMRGSYSSAGYAAGKNASINKGVEKQSSTLRIDA